MPRQRQTARPSTNHVDDPSKRAHQKDTKQLLSEVLGSNPDFADRFFGESPNMTRLVRSTHTTADGDVGVNGVESPNGSRDAGESSKQQHHVPRNGASSGITIENTPHDIDQLIIRQLEEDLDSYRYDVDFCKTQLDPENVANITPAEVRTFQLRLLDLGHQMRSIHHRIQVMQAGINNLFFSGHPNGSAGATTANAYYGPYPPGANLQVSAYNQGRLLQPTSAYSAYQEGPQERRGPGRPLGSKNRSMKPLPDASASTTASAKAAALASAGAKRTLPSEITVAVRDGEEIDEGGAGTPGKSKRARVDAGVDSLEGNHSEGHPHVAPSPAAGATPLDEEAREDSIAMTENSEILATAGEAMRPTDVLAAANGLPASAEAYTRLGRWMCTLCTSQKYLKAPPPKQPAEPSSWPLRDISKIVTHFTRMHTEQTDGERCQELGNALSKNLGPFKYWIRVTKKLQVDDEQIQQALSELREGNLPDLLRRLSTAAAQFPGRN